MKKEAIGNTLFGDLTNRRRGEAIEQIIDQSAPTKSYYFMLVAASILCTLGLLGNNSAVIIGGMLVAPLLAPILALALGIGVSDNRLMFRSVKIILISIVVAITSSFVIAVIDHTPNNFNYQMQLRLGVSWQAIVVALVAGLAAGLALVREELQEHLTGTAIAVALIPPLSMTAISLKMGKLDYFVQSLAQFGINLVGIILAAVLIFSLSGLYLARRRVGQELREENVQFGRVKKPTKRKRPTKKRKITQRSTTSKKKK